MSDHRDQQAGAYARALALLSRRERSCAELKSRLAARGMDAEEIDAALERLKQHGFQSDERFAELLARSRIAQGHGPIRILAELRQHGIDEAEARAAIETEGPDWSSLATQLCRRRFRGSAEDHAERVRRANFLARRGFPAAIARAVAGETFDES